MATVSGEPKTNPHMITTNEGGNVNSRTTLRSRTTGEATAVLIALDGLFSPVAVDVMDVSSGGVGILMPQSVPLVVGRQVALRLPVKPSGYKLYRMEVRWLKPGDLFDSAGLTFL